VGSKSKTSKEKSHMNTSLFKIILASTIAFTGWHMGMDWLDSASGKPFDPVKATQIRRSLLKIEWGQVGLCSRQFSKSKKITCKNSRVKLENYSKK